MILEFFLKGEFPGLNDILDAAKLNRYAYADMKETYTAAVQWQVKRCLQITKPFTIRFVWITKDAKTDPDNTCAAQKFVFDGLVKEKVIPNDTRRYVKQITHYFGIDRFNPGVEVQIEEVED